MSGAGRIELPQGTLSIYLTAGYPSLADTIPLVLALQDAGVDLIEIGMPFSDPIADGPIIQKSSEIALANGMTIERLFSDLESARSSLRVPILLMGYLNPVLQFGMRRFCQRAAEVGVAGVILPDLPLAEFDREYRSLFAAHGLHNVLLVTPTTSDERIRLIDERSTAFIYAVSSTAVTGTALALDSSRAEYLQRLRDLHLRHPVLVGFGISDRATFEGVCTRAHGAIIGSAFIDALAKGEGTPAQRATAFIRSLRGDSQGNASTPAVGEPSGAP